MKIDSCKKGFTLIELLVVIAIVSILVIIVVVVIDPVSRINDSQEARANANVRATASSVGACITKEEDPYTLTTCASETYLINNKYLLNKPEGVELTANIAEDKVCIYEEVGSGNYSSWQSETGEMIVAPFGVSTCT